MWLYTTEGFFSIGAQNCIKDVEVLQVRARVKIDLIRLMNVLKVEEKIHVDIGTDYAFRIFIGRSQIAKYITDYVESLRYSNFKNEVAKADQACNMLTREAIKERHTAYYVVWAAMAELQDKVRRLKVFSKK